MFEFERPRIEIAEISEDKKYAGSAAKQAGAAAKLAKKQAQTAGRKLKDRKK